MGDGQAQRGASSVSYRHNFLVFFLFLTVQIRIQRAQKLFLILNLL